MDKKNFKYNEFTNRNSGYISENTQKNIAETVLFIAGCGIGSTIAEAAVRMGFQKFILADGDTVSVTNLNRQIYTYNDVGQYKVKAMAKRMREINPNIEVLEVCENLNASNLSELVPKCDIICDTIDFLDLSGILELHDQALKYKKPLISAVGAGWGAAAMFIPAMDAKDIGGVSLIRQLFGVAPGKEKSKSYSEVFSGFFSALAQHLDQSIIEVMKKAFTLMEDGKPCPASQVVSGSFAVASLTMTILNQLISGEKVVTAPYLMLSDNLGVVRNSSINLVEDIKSNKLRKGHRQKEITA